jgi:hypothetical protein
VSAGTSSAYSKTRSLFGCCPHTPRRREERCIGQLIPMATLPILWAAAERIISRNTSTFLPRMMLFCQYPNLTSHSAQIPASITASTTAETKSNHTARPPCSRLPRPFSLLFSLSPFRLSSNPIPRSIVDRRRLPIRNSTILRLVECARHSTRLGEGGADPPVCTVKRCCTPSPHVLFSSPQPYIPA